MIKVELYKNILGIEATGRVEEGLLSSENYQKMTQRGRLEVIRRGGNGRTALVAYDSLPVGLRRAVGERIGNPYDAVRRGFVESYLEHSAKAGAWFDDYRLDDGRCLPRVARQEYYYNSLVLDALGRLLEARRVRRAALGRRLRINWENISEDIQSLDREKWSHNLPVNPRRLRDRYNAYKRDGYASLIHGSFANRNAQKVDDEVKKSVLIELLGDPRNFDNAQIMRLYNGMAAKLDWSKISESTVGVWRNRYDLEIYAGRRGASEFWNVKGMQVKRKAPSYPLYYWSMDGWDVELLYQRTDGSVTTYHHRPTVVVILDACMKYPVGYAVGTHETPELILSALRNAALHTRELFGRMYRVSQLQSDRYAIKKMTPAYETMAKYVTPARVKNAKSKVVEPYFATVNKRYCQFQKNWSGFGIVSDKDSQPNVEYLNKSKSDFPDFAGVVRQVSQIIECERTCEGRQEQYVALWNRAPADRRIELNWEDYVSLFGENTGRRNRLESSGLYVTIRGERRCYDSFDIAFRQASATTGWEVRYDPDDLSRVLAVSEDESRVFVLEEKYVQPMALVERQEGDSEALQRVREYNKALEEHVIEVRAQAGATLREAAIEVPELNETLQKLLITDNSGQHKVHKKDQNLQNFRIKQNDEADVARKDQNLQDFRIKQNDEDGTKARREYLRKKADVAKYID
jgi:hypothetical protein